MRRHAGIGFFSIQIIELADMTGTRKAHDKYSRLHGCRRPVLCQTRRDFAYHDQPA